MDMFPPPEWEFGRSYSNCSQLLATSDLHGLRECNLGSPRASCRGTDVAAGREFAAAARLLGLCARLFFNYKVS